ncbi:Cold shock domain-containing protein E1, partial [Bonamia ostreae]
IFTLLKNKAKIDVKISYKQRNLVDPKIDIFEGDIVSFRKKFDLRFNGSVSAIQIVLIKPNESFKRSEGIVISLKRDFGFLTCLEYPDGLFFHFSSVVGDAKKSLSCNDEFSFEIKTDGNGKAIATRMIKLAKNTVQLDDIDSTPFIGKIINTGYSYKLDDDFLG